MFKKLKLGSLNKHIFISQVRKKTSLHHINAWELLEDNKQAGPLNLAMFGAVKIERKPPRYIEESLRLLHHTHQKRKPLSYYLSDALPEEDDGPATPSTPSGTSNAHFFQYHLFHVYARFHSPFSVSIIFMWQIINS